MSNTTFDWIASLIKAVIIFVVLLQLVPVLIWLERKVVARMQQRIGPNRVGPFGLLQPLADAVKLMAKENIIPTGVDKLVYYLAPVISIVPALAAFAVVPFGEPIHVAGRVVYLQVAHVNIGILYVLALSSLAVYGITLAGWSSNNKYSLLGGLRASAQMISYEIPVGLTVVAVVLLAGSLDLLDIVNQQVKQGIWNIGPQFIGFLLFVVASNAELNRAPFDMAEAESELVAGFHTEYTGFRFAMFFMGEYVNMVTTSALATVMYLGGWHGFGPDVWYLNLIWFILKIFAFIIFYMWVRASWPRIRYDQLMGFGWKVMIPAALLNLAATAVVIVVAKERATLWLTAVNIALFVVFLAVLRLVNSRQLEQHRQVVPQPDAVRG
ncbi:MAG: NADH-quinone oxidoreductase subunit NuoH [Armatimonadetes bacterium]|nr:NADH-quinone oxidoreductase subunit NuoH [Armatimonadota bacterium]